MATTGKIARTVLAFVSAIAWTACQPHSYPTAPSGAATVMNTNERRAPAERGTIPEPHAFVSAGASKVDMCHVTGNGSFHLINVSADAEPAHRAHGDAKPGEPVPGNASFQFDAACNQVQAATPLMCPCWNQYSQQQLLDLLDAAPVANRSCTVLPTFVSATDNVDIVVFAGSDASACRLRLEGKDTGLVQGLTAQEANQCIAEATALVQLNDWCP